MKQFKVAIFVLLGLLSVSCASMATDSGADDYQSMIAKAEDAYKAVDEMGGAWRDTGEMIANAKKEAEASNYDKAFALASQAYQQAAVAAKQHETEAKANPWLF